MASGTRTDLEPNANLREVISQDRAAQMLNVGKRSLQLAKEIIRKAPEKVVAVETGKKTLNE